MSVPSKKMLPLAARGLHVRRLLQHAELALARRDALRGTFYARVLDGDVQCAALVTKITERRCVTLDLSTPQTAIAQIVDESTPKEMSIDKLGAQDKKTDPTTH